MTLKERFDAKWQENPETGCWDWTGSRSNNGYGGIWSCGKMLKAHRVSHELYKGPIPPGMDICHECHRKCCVNPEHLHVGTRKDNIREMLEAGRHKPPCLRGEKVGTAKLTEDEARLIKRALDRLPPKCGSFLARWFGVSRHAISHIHRGDTWTHV